MGLEIGIGDIEAVGWRRAEVMALAVFSSLLIISPSCVGIAGNHFWLDYSSEDP